MQCLKKVHDILVLSTSFRQPHPSLSVSDSPFPAPIPHLLTLCQLTTLAIHKCLTLSPPAQDLPLSQIFPTIDSLLAPGLTPRTLRLAVSSE